ncbi:C6 finger domain protein [Penicillium cf. viridicatum]|uniref:C6 finger domain protein n=1 Tax=Penicillium cf. viridicatum TaxID=2972119 RepID=A0A9W9JL88_9EURO|nr:C6 finger domain protein [Penicillium cf. viridicatum]
MDDAETPSSRFCNWSASTKTSTVMNPATARDASRTRPASHPNGPTPQGLQICPLDFNATLNATTDLHRLKSSLNMYDLKLLQHYILHTSKRMTLHPEKALVWERIITDIASEAEYLMHLLLALAGLDVLTTHSNISNQTKHNNSLIQIVIKHHQKGLKGLQQGIHSIGASNLEDLLTGTLLINAFAFASLRVRELNHSTEDLQHYPTMNDIPEIVPDNNRKPQSQWLYLIRGTSSILTHSWMHLRRCRLRSLLVFNKANEDWEHFRSELNDPIELSSGILSTRLSAFVSNASQAICDLRAFLNALKATIAPPLDDNNSAFFPTPGSNMSPANSTHYLLQDQDRAIEVVEMMYMRILYVLSLRRTGAQDSSESDLEIQTEIEDAAVASWPTLVGEGFILSLDSDSVHGSAQGLSLTILSHLYLTLALLDKIWYFDGTFDLEIKKIAAFVNQNADVELVELMKWPMHVIEQ